MKKTRKFAALLASVMAVSGMGAMSAFAETTTYIDLDIDVNANMSEFQTALTEHINDGNTYLARAFDNDGSAANPEYRESNVPIKLTEAIVNDGVPVATWMIGITADELSWTITKTVNGGNLEWDGSTYTSTGGTATYTMDTTSKEVQVENKCNFSVSVENIKFSPFSPYRRGSWSSEDFTIGTVTKNTETFNLSDSLQNGESISFSIAPSNSSVTSEKAESLGEWVNGKSVDLGSLTISFNGNINNLYPNE